MAVDAPAVLKCVVNQIYVGGWNAQNIFYWYLPPGSDSMPETTLLDALKDKVEDMWDNLNDYISSGFAMDSLDVDVVEWDEELAQWVTTHTVGSINLSDSFASATDVMPPFVAAVLTGFTNGVRTRARKSIAGITEGACATGAPTSALLAALALWAGEWLLDVVLPDTNELQAITVNHLGEVWAIAEVILSDILGSQNSRKFRVGD